jgi:ferrous iron transport protein B
MAGIYIASIGLVSITAAILGRVLRMDASDSGFQIELPRWRLPIFRHIAVWTFDQTLSFIRRAGPTIIGISVILWVLSTFPSPQASFITHISQALEPVLRPMGIDGRVGIALLLSFAAREVFVSALALVFSLGPDQDTLLLSALHKATWVGTQQPMFTPATIIGLIVFFMISMQCMSTLAVAKKEMGSWKWPIIMGVCYIGVAYILSIFCVRILS